MTSEAEFHPAIRAMLAVSRALARKETPPSVAASERDLADRLFAVERTSRGEARVRAFGEALPSLFGRDLRGEDFAELLYEGDRGLLLALLDASEAALEPAVMQCEAETVAHSSVLLEILFAPIEAAAISGVRRHVGLIQPLNEVPTGEAASPIAGLRIQRLFPPRARARARRLRLVVVND